MVKTGVGLNSVSFGEEDFTRLLGESAFTGVAITKLPDAADGVLKLGAKDIAEGEIGSGWLKNGYDYASYNLGIMAALLYSTAGCESRKEAVGSGLMSGVIAVLPAMFLFLALSAFHPEYMAQEVPVNLLFEKLDMPWLYWAFEIVLFGTLIETGMGFIKAVVDRVEVAYDKAKGSVPKWVRPAITVGLMGIGLAISAFGITAIILKGYGSLPTAYLITLILPLLTVGIYKIYKHDKAEK
jgi:uncharacterized membrane protein YkvI